MTSNAPTLPNEKGFVIVLFSMIISLIITFLAFALDLGLVFDERQKIQNIADVAALAAVDVLGIDVTYSAVVSTIVAVGQANGATSEEITAVRPQCGTWSDDTFTPQSDGTCTRDATAVAVTIQRQRPSIFAHFVTSSSAPITASAVSYKPPYKAGNCIRPFGVEGSFISTLNLQPGEKFTLSGTQSSGNWGKIDLDGNSSSGQQFTNLMINNLCDDLIAVGQTVSVGTGNAQMQQVFDTLASDTTPPYAYKRMVFAVTTDFPSGNGSVDILRFIRVDFVSQGGSGMNWQATFRVVNPDAEPESPSPPRRQLMQ